MDDVLVWSQSLDEYSGDATLCGADDGDALVPVTIEISHVDATARIRFATTLDSDDLSWGLKSVAVYASTPAVNIAYQTNFEDVGAWIFDGADPEVTVCGESNVLGGYGVLDYDDSVTLFLGDLIPHSSMTIEFNFVRLTRGTVKVHGSM